MNEQYSSPILSIVIPTCNRKKFLFETIIHIASRKVVVPKPYEIIIVQNGEEDISEILKVAELPLKIIESYPRYSLAVARNYGIKHSKGDIICFIDDDILVNENFFIRCLNVHSRFGDILYRASREYPEKLIHEANSYSFGRYKIKYEYKPQVKFLQELEDGLYVVDGLAGYSLSIKRSTIEKIGMFDERFRYAGCEDAEFAYRASKLGLPIIFDTKNICYHNEYDKFFLEQ